MSKGRKRPNYTKEFKQDAIKLVLEQGYSCHEVGSRLSIASSNVSLWVRLHHQDLDDRTGNGLSRRELEDENRRLKKRKQTVADGARNIKKSRGLLCQRVELRHDFIRQQMKAYPVTLICKVMNVSRR